MAIRSMKMFCGLLLLLLVAVPALACFGPKLYLGVSDDATGQVLSSFVAIYVKETTGTDVVRVPLKGLDPVNEITEERIDFSFSDIHGDGMVVLMNIEGLRFLISGPRIMSDLQFTTVGPSLVNLEAKLTVEDVASLVRKVEAGEMAMDVVRQFLINRRWI